MLGGNAVRTGEKVIVEAQRLFTLLLRLKTEGSGGERVQFLEEFAVLFMAFNFKVCALIIVIAEVVFRADDEPFKRIFDDCLSGEFACGLRRLRFSDDALLPFIADYLDGCPLERALHGAGTIFHEPEAEVLNENETRYAGALRYESRERNAEKHPAVVVFALHPLVRNLVKRDGDLEIGINGVQLAVAVQVFAIKHLIVSTEGDAFKRAVERPTDVFTGIQCAVATVSEFIGEVL